VITYYFRNPTDETILELAKPQAGVWVHAVAPTKDDLQSLITTFSLDEDIIEDATDIYEVPRMERSQGATYFFTRYPLRDQLQENATAPLLLILGEGFIISISVLEVPQFKKLISGEEIVYTTQKAKLFIQIMTILTSSFDRELLRLRKAVHKDRVRLQSIGPREIERLVGYESILNSIVDALIPTNSWLQQVANGSYLQLYADDVEEMQDLVIANGQVVGSARSILKTIQNIRSASEAIMTSRLNNALRNLTVLTILLTVPLVVASLFGMNVPVPFADGEYTFYAIVLLNAAILGGLAFIFRRNDWF